jgi:hypothetical protein
MAYSFIFFPHSYPFYYKWNFSLHLEFLYWNCFFVVYKWYYIFNYWYLKDVSKFYFAADLFLHMESYKIIYHYRLCILSMYAYLCIFFSSTIPGNYWAFSIWRHISLSRPVISSSNIIYSLFSVCPFFFSLETPIFFLVIFLNPVSH